MKNYMICLLITFASPLSFAKSSERYQGVQPDGDRGKCTVQVVRDEAGQLKKVKVDGTYKVWNPTTIPNILRRAKYVGGAIAIGVLVPFLDEDFTDWKELVVTNATDGELEDGAMELKSGQLSVGVAGNLSEPTDYVGSRDLAENNVYTSRRGFRLAHLNFNEQDQLQEISIYYKWDEKSIYCSQLKPAE